MSSLSLASDLEKLKTIVPEKQSLFLFNALSTHYQTLALLDTSLLSAQSSTLLDDLIVCLRAPGVHRAHRNLLGRCFVTTFRRTEKSPFESTNKILSLLQRERDDKFKWNAIVVLGIIFENVGDQIVSLLGELVSTLGRISKPSSVSPGIKTAAFNAIGSALSTTHKLDEVIYREVMKILKTGLPDKSAIAHVAAFDVSGYSASSVV